MFRYLFVILLLAGCTIGPVSKENAYNGEPLKQISPDGLLVAHAKVPLDSFPHDRRTTILYFENIKTKKQYQFGDTKGPIYMRLPPGDYRIMDFWKPKGCNTATGHMISNFFYELPENVQYLRRALEQTPASTLNFRISSGRMTDIGNLLVTCMEWNERPAFKHSFTNYISNGKFQMFKLGSPEAQECGCKLLRKKDGVSVREMKRALEGK